MKFRRNIKSILTGTLIIAVLVFVFVVIEFFESRRELIKTLSNEAQNLNEALSLSFENAIMANQEIESQLVGKLEAVASLIAGQKAQTFPAKTLNFLKNEFRIDYIAVINRYGKVILTSEQNSFNGFSGEFLDALNQNLTKSNRTFDFGITYNSLAGRKMYLMAEIGNNENEIVLVGLNAEKIEDFKKKIGIGSQIQEIADNPDIIYLLLQEGEGSISASKGLREISAIESDKFLQEALKTNSVLTRFYDYNGTRVFESVKSFKMTDGTKVLTRFALSLDNIKSIQQRSVRRVILIGLGIFVLFSLLYVFLLTRKGLSELRKEHRKVKSYTDLVIDNMADALVAVNNANEITYFNNAAVNLFKISKEKALEQKYDKLFVADTLEIIRSKELKEPLLNFRKTITATDDSKKILELNISHITDNAGNIELTIALINDLTETINLQEKAERKEKLSAMGELAAGVAHEIRNPLNSIGIIAQRIQNEFAPTADAEEYRNLVSTIRSEVLRLNKIIKQFLDFARPRKLHLTIIRLNDILNECLNLFMSEAELKKINLEIDCSYDLIIELDKEKIKQVMINLLRNSFDALKSGGYVIIKARKTGNSAEIIISDDGEGIKEELISKIFNLYFTTKSDGNGLGLSIVHQIISEHNGSVEIKSTEKKGTTVAISLPLKQT